MLDPEDVAGPLYDVTLDAVGYLRKSAPNSARLESVYETLLAIPNSNQRDIRLGWLVDLPAPENAPDRPKRRSAEQVKRSWEKITEVLQNISRGPAP